MNTYDRMVPRGLLVGTAGALVIVWVSYAAGPNAWPGLTGAVVQSVLLAGNVVLTALRPAWKVGIVRLLQRRVINPTVRAAFAVGLNPLGLVVLETRGRRSGRARRVPVGNGRVGSDVWVIAEHGLRAGYVRNVLADPRVRVRLRVGLRYRWYDGVAEVLPDDDALARQRWICRWHPLRTLNALTVRVLGADLVTVRIRLGDPSPAAQPVADPTGAVNRPAPTSAPAPAVARIPA